MREQRASCAHQQVGAAPGCGYVRGELVLGRCPNTLAVAPSWTANFEKSAPHNFYAFDKSVIGVYEFWFVELPGESASLC